MDFWTCQDFKDFEFMSFDLKEVNQFVGIKKPYFGSIEQLINCIKDSNSKLSLFTSGTTGQPKQVSHNFNNLTRTVKIYFNSNPNVWAFAYNPSHMAGIQVFFQAIFNESSLINVFNVRRDIVFHLIQKYKVTNMSATPTFYRLLLPCEMSFDFVKMVTFGGEKSDESLYRQVKQIFPNAQIRNIYASTEAGALLSSQNNLFLIPNDKSNLLKIVDNELLIHKSLMGSSDNLVLVNDFYHSGDLIEWVDESNGFFRFVSRKNESINVGGYKINPSEIEALICEIEGVQNALVFGKVNSVLGNILCAEVIIFDNYVLSELSIKNYLKQKLQSHKIPRHIKFVDNFLMTKTGKIQRL